MSLIPDFFAEFPMQSTLRNRYLAVKKFLLPSNSSSRAAAIPRGATAAIATCSACILVALFSLFATLPYFGVLSVTFSIIMWVLIVTLILRNLRFHSHQRFGQANNVTTARIGIAVVLAGFIPVAAELTSSIAWLWAITIAAAFALCVDGLDGYLARKTGLCSAFGARFDMETDALLALVITLLVWQSGTAGFWVLALGLMRYAFLAASMFLTPLRAPLFPSLRRKTVCVIQVGALCLMLCPWFTSVQVSVIGMAALVCLVYSFFVDIVWLFRAPSRLTKP